jgi:HlyD family secretion protein
MRKRIPIVVAVLVLAAIGWWAWTTYGNGGTAAADVLGGSGTIEGDDVMVSAQTSGRIVTGEVDEGSVVQAGSILYRIDQAILKAQYDQAAAGVRSAKAAHKQVVADDASTNADIAAAQAQIDQAEAAQRIARIQFDYTEVKAPVTGVLTDKVIDVGENAVAGQTLAIITDTENLTVTIYVTESLIGQVKIGQTGSLSTDSAPDTSFDCHVVFIASQPEFTPASVETKEQRVKLVYQVRLAIDDAKGLLKPGMPADVTLDQLFGK